MTAFEWAWAAVWGAAAFFCFGVGFGIWLTKRKRALSERSKMSV